MLLNTGHSFDGGFYFYPHFLFFELFSNSSSLRPRATIHRNSAWTEFSFSFLICCHLYNNGDVTQRGQPVPRVHQLATYVYMKFVLSLATLPKEKALRRNIHDKSRFHIPAIVCRRGGLMPHICHQFFRFTYVYIAPFQQQFATSR